MNMTKLAKNNIEGLLLVSKPGNMTSHDIVDFVRNKFKIRRVGHAGTLDPLAEGLLIVLVGKYTKLFPKFVNFDKEYLGVLKLGEVTTTGDCEGQLVKQEDYSYITESRIREVFSSFEGEIEQVPPMVSAVRVGGKRLYSLARKGITIARPARRVNIYSLNILNINLPFVEFCVRCSKGTYVRKLAEDIGERLGCGAHIIKIKRLSIGRFKLEDAVKLDDIDESHLQKTTI
ncbi:MAG: tRNA pseudouridine(55) synthase TruB [Candidatus Omnitrophica bacterium]|nr:tRNA pseudouridine(55) synthase TruB [Candidatus Omnitrophota bacterium]